MAEGQQDGSEPHSCQSKSKKIEYLKENQSKNVQKKEEEKIATVETLFIDANTGQAIGRADMPMERLPQSFERETTLHIGNEDWTVIKAEPMTSAEFGQTGKLVLTLQKIIQVSPKDILFTLPTLCNEIPTLLNDSTKRGKDVLELHEDDWRQIEFVSVSHRDSIDFELAKIRSIYQEASIDNGHFLAFKTLHVRKRIPTPLRDGIPLSELTQFFTSVLQKQYEGVSFQQDERLVDGGFAFQALPVVLYGQHTEGLIKILGIRVGEKAPENQKNIVHFLHHLMSTYHLSLIDWCRIQVMTAEAEAIETFLKSMP